MLRLVTVLVVVAMSCGLTAWSAVAGDSETCDNGSGDRAIAACTRMIESGKWKGRDLAIGFYNRGLEYNKKNDYDRAIADFDQAIRLDPKFAKAFAERASAYRDKDEYDRAIADFDQAVRLDPKNVFALAGRGALYRLQGEYDRAIGDLDRAIRLDPKNAFAFAERGGAYVGKDEYDRAITDLDQAIQLNPKDAFALAHRGSAYRAKDEYDRAITDLDRAIRLDPKDAFALAERGAAYLGKDEYDRAIGELDQAIRLDPKDAFAYNKRGEAYNSKSEYDRAIADFDWAIRLGPKDAVALHNRGDAYTGKREYDHAIADYDAAIRLDPKDADSFNERGDAYYSKGDLSHAIADYSEAIRLNPKLTEARKSLERARTALAASRPPAPTPIVPSIAGRRLALVIGIDHYPNLRPAAQLERAVADAEAVGDTLAQLGFTVTRLTGTRNTGLDGILDGFETFKRTVMPGDLVVLFYAGHGMGLSNGTYLVPADAKENDLDIEAKARRAAVNEAELTEGLRQAGAGIVVAVIDACRNDVFTRALRRSGMGERGLRPAPTEGIFKLYSASEGQSAMDRLPGADDGSKNSLFTRIFLKALGTPGLNLSTLGTTVRDEVYGLARRYDAKQTPAVYDRLVGSSRVVLAPGPTLP